MKALRIIVVLAILVGVVGFYRHWFQVSSQNDNGNTNINLNVDKDKMRQDTTQATQDIRQLGTDIKNKVTSSTQPSN